MVLSLNNTCREESSQRYGSSEVLSSLDKCSTWSSQRTTRLQTLRAAPSSRNRLSGGVECDQGGIEEWSLPEARVYQGSSGLGHLSQVSEALKTRLASKNCTVREIMEIANEYLEAVEGGRLAEAGFADGMYGTSKLLLIAWTKALAREAMEDPRRILATTCTPGYCATDMTK
ncbi:hypothetical protein FOZ60_000770 [Perkinsus olseni]|uniref:Uncharacterized protein n=1 Tax=Perkinsus olseni TaxID=32597 RepID=A0A7J6P2G2_PEROL|nr:hypothetical protein FOZ60_000770 [Perkinsus olseni]